MTWIKPFFTYSAYGFFTIMLGLCILAAIVTSIEVISDSCRPVGWLEKIYRAVVCIVISVLLLTGMTCACSGIGYLVRNIARKFLCN